MEMKRLVCLAVVAMLATAGAWASHHEGPMEALSKAWEEAYNSGDVAAVVAMYSEDGTRMPPNMPAVIGHEAIQMEVQGGMDRGLVKVKITLDESEMMGEVGFGRGTFEGMDAEGNSIGTGKWANAVKMVDGEWKIHYDIWNQDAPMPAPE